MGDRKKIPNFFGSEPDPVEIATGTKRYSGKEEQTRSDTDTRKHSTVKEQGHSSMEEPKAHPEEQIHSGIEERSGDDKNPQISSATDLRIYSGTEEQGESSVEEQEDGAEKQKNNPVTEKKKTGYYLPVDMIETFDRIFYNLKLKGVRFKKNDLAEAIFKYGLKDLERGGESEILTKIIG